MIKNFENRFLGAIPTILVLSGLVLVGMFLQQTSEETKDRQLQGQTYARFVACTLSIPPRDRDGAKIDRCWVEAQEDTGKTVKRYDQ